ncbi:hypothetical protein F5X99DRAFT_432201 [Biscogniauxia marginata]|nr:hypothetical protein F5X99DRAFT_432201 [Biscogniauxia marginata]
MSETPFCPKPGFHSPEALISLTLARPPKDSPRHAEQIAIKDAFVALYLQEEKPPAEQLARKYMLLLDKYFFFGSLCTIMKLSVLQEDTNKPNLCGVHIPSTREIRLYLRPEGRQRQPDEVLATLIHEMVHAYIKNFSNKYLAKSPQELGAHRRHGVYWNSLFLSIVNQVRSWDSKLEGFVTKAYRKTSQKYEIQEREDLGLLTKKLSELDLEKNKHKNKEHNGGKNKGGKDVGPG